MKSLTIEIIAKVCGGTIKAKEYDVAAEAKGVVLDSRLVEEGFVFVATVGERVDGHSFIKQVFEKGALAVIAEKMPEDYDESVYGPIIIVKDSFKALTELATYYREVLDIKVVGITGSVGKTSTKEFIAGTLSEKFNVLKTQGNFNNEIGVPLTILRIRDEHQVAVVEMGINHFGEMSRLTQVAKPDVVVMTNIGECHLEFLGDRDGVLKAKSEIFEGLRDGGRVVLYGDDDKLITVNEVNGLGTIKFGYNEEFDWCGSDIKDKGLYGSDVVIKHCDGTSFEAHVPLPGRHMVNNALAASAVGYLFGMTSEQIAKGIASVKAVSGRSNIISAGNMTVIDDCYNANPVSTKAAIDLLTMADTRKVAILGDMFELGQEEAALHRSVGEYAACKNIDVVICVGDLSKNTYEGAKSKAEKALVYHFDTRDAAIEKMPEILKDNDSILVKASHGMHFEEIVNTLKK